MDKHKRVYIKQWFDDNQEFKQGDTLVFEMPPFCSGDYTAKIHLDSDGDPYIKKSKNFYKGCRDVYVISKNN